MPQAMWNEVEYRLAVCHATKGANIETYWEGYSEKNDDSFPL
jgi:hypothetical protein